MKAERVVDEVALTAAHKAVEDVLVEMRDARMGVIGPANGFVIKERDGEPSEVMRLGTREGLKIAIRAYLDAVEVDHERCPAHPDGQHRNTRSLIPASYSRCECGATSEYNPDRFA